MYFSFTTLSTVGFGDYHPRSDPERIFCCFVLLFGVAIFSYIMGNFIEILNKFQNMNADIDEGDDLAMFFGLLKRFNGNRELNHNLVEKIINHFDIRWRTNRYSALESDSD